MIKTMYVSEALSRYAYSLLHQKNLIKGGINLISGTSIRYLSNSQIKEHTIIPCTVINKKHGLNMNITERAASRLGEIFKDSKEILKVGVESGGCHGFQYVLKLINENEIYSTNKNSSDIDEFTDKNLDKNVIFVLPHGKGKVVIDEDSLKILNKTTLTYTTELIGSSFKIDGGNMKSSCGCGSSFDIDVN